ncbi:MAG TPA: NUDIX hydrolase [Bacteroidetes bacterium]|nr:NUDIX hydrolase [Bacteroidota bacterium]
MFTYKYPRPSVTADSIVLCKKEGRAFILLIQRAHDPYKGKWALPGGFMDENEQLEDTARRELQEETGIVAGNMTFAGMFDKPDRDPRGRTITAVYLTRLKKCVEPVAGDDAGKARWFPLDNLPELAFDHKEIIRTTIDKR